MVQTCLSEHEIKLMLINEVPAEQLAIWKQHLRTCDLCATKLAKLRLGTDIPAPSLKPHCIESGIHRKLTIGLEPNVQIGDFRIEKRIAIGGMGIVYQAHQISLNRPVALKVLTFNLASNEAAVERFHREAHAAAKLQHPNIVSVYAEGVEDQICYYAMELVDGQTLSQLIKSYRHNSPDCQPETQTPPETKLGNTAFNFIQTRLSTRTISGKKHFDTIANIIVQAADALDYAHQHGVIHRDLKPANLMLTHDGHLKITDFGIARVLDEEAITLTSSSIGTPLYMSPEQVRGDLSQPDHRSDIYSLGVTLYELLTLRPLYEGLQNYEQVMTHILTKIPKKPRQIDKQIPVDLETICLKAIEPNPEKRYSTAGDFADDLKRYLNRQVIKAKPAGIGDCLAKFLCRHKVSSALTAVIILTAAIAAFFGWNTTQNYRIEKLITQITQLIEQDQYFKAFALAQKVDRQQPDNPVLNELWPQFTREHTITTKPAGATVYFEDYYAEDSDWIKLGTSPLEKIRAPLGTFRWIIEKKGYAPLEFVRAGGSPYFLTQQCHYTLHEKNKYPKDMIWIPAATLHQDIFHVNKDIADAPAFLIDKYEVTHRQFKEFVDAGGYRTPEFWEHSFIKNGQSLTWQQAIELFTDSTGRPGPSTWSKGTYPEGHENYPVGGVSWYEAAAYAKFRNKDLPTSHHWYYAATKDDWNSRTVFRSNFSDKPAPVGSYSGTAGYGLYDTAGNVREWCYNSLKKNGDIKNTNTHELRCLLGGAWSDPAYTFQTSNAITPWDRDQGNGFRCALYLEGRDQVPAAAFEPLENRMFDESMLKPEPKEVVESYIQTYFQYAPLPLNAVVEFPDDEPEHCRTEKITYDAVYADERIIAYLFLPKEVAAPYQTVVWFPGSYAINGSWNPKSAPKGIISPIVKSGRAMIVPFYKGTYDRSVDKSKYPSGSLRARNLFIQQMLDLKRTVDYLQTREDINSEKLAYMGYSWGGTVGPCALSVEKRFKTGIFLLAGLCIKMNDPVGSAVNFSQCVDVPVLMINGEEDAVHPYYPNQKLLFDWLGTPEPHKKHVTFPGGHGIAWEYKDQYYRTFLDWLDQYLGPVPLNAISQSRGTQPDSTK